MKGLSLLLSVLLAISVVGSARATDLEVSELVAAIKRGIAEAQKSAGPPEMRIPWIEAEISYVVKQEVDGGIKLYVVTIGGKYATEEVQRVKYRLEPTRPLKVEAPGELSGAVAGLDRAANKVFITGWDLGFGQTGHGGASFPFAIKSATKIVDRAGNAKSLTDLKPGTTAKITYDPGFVAKYIVINP